MTLSPLAVPFFCCTPISSLVRRDSFLERAMRSLSHFDASLFSSILAEWEFHPLLSSCLSSWKSFSSCNSSSVSAPLLVLSFNVRGFDARWQEVILLDASYSFDIIILLETGGIDGSLCAQAFPGFNRFAQKGENKNGGVMLLVRAGIQVNRVPCDLPNVCVVDILGQEATRVLGIYAPESRSWTWDDLSPLISENCVALGDWNTDLERDSTKAESLLAWADGHSLAPFVPDSATSLRSNRVIDYALSNNSIVEIQAYVGNTSSDHKPILAVLPSHHDKTTNGISTHWNVFTLFSEFAFPFWEARWRTDGLDETYNEYISFLALLEARCSVYFPLDRYRIALPRELRCAMSYVRALSFRQKRTRDASLKIQIGQMRKAIKIELRAFIDSQLSMSLRLRHSSVPLSVSFWSKIKRNMNQDSPSLRAFILPSGEVVKDPAAMCAAAAVHYEELFHKVENVMRPHPYLDAPIIEHDNADEAISLSSFEEVIEAAFGKKMKKSRDAHGLSNYMLKFLDQSHWQLLTDLYNRSFASALLPRAWKDTRMLLLAKKDAICSPAQTRPISLLDAFQKIGEKLFLTRFRRVLVGRGLLPNNQSGFREKFRIQSRLLLFLEDLSSVLANSSPTATIFVDFRSAFDMLWHEGCLGKLAQMGIPRAYRDWIKAWLEDRRGFIEIKGAKSRWFNIDRGGPQGGVLSPTLFISYHADMPEFLSWCTSHFFADDLAAIVSGQIGMKFCNQCLDLEKRLGSFLEQLEAYAILTLQPLNLSKTLGLWSARAVGSAPFKLVSGSMSLDWVSEFKYLGYWVCPKLGWGVMIRRTKLKVRQRMASLSALRFGGVSSPALRRALFSSYVLPLFTWLMPIYPLFTTIQRNDLDHFYVSCLKRVMHCSNWNDVLFVYTFDEISLHDRCLRYWNKYLLHLADSTDGDLLLEKSALNFWRQAWLRKEISVAGLRRSKRFVEHDSVLETILKWTASRPSSISIPELDPEDIETLQHFPESFVLDQSP